MPLAVGGLKTIRSCKSRVEPANQVRERSEGFELKHSFHMQETSWSSKLTFPEKGGGGTAPVNVRRV